MKHTKKKKLLAFVLCMILVLSTGISAFAYDNTSVQAVACQATKLEQPIKNADGKQIGTLTADVPEGAFHAASSDADIQMEVTANTKEADVLEQVQKLTEDTVGTSVVADVTFYVDGQKQAPQQAITFQVTGTDLNAEKTAAFAENGKNTPELMDVAVADNGGLQFTAKASDAMTMTYGVFEKEAATEENDNDSIIDTQQTIAYEQTYSDDQVEIKVTAADGVLPEDAQLQVTPVVKTDITDTMSEEEKQAAEAVNAKYDTTEQKLNEKATDEAYDIAGFLAYDISFLDKDGNKVEPNGDVNVSMNYKEAAIPETAQKAIEEKTEDATTNVTIMHLEENANGEVEKVVDMVADENEKANVEVTNTQSVQKAEFVSDSFSVFTLIWKNSSNSDNASGINIKVVDSFGNEIPSHGDYTFTSDSTNTAQTLANIAPSIPYYTYSRATVGSYNGNAIKKVKLVYSSNYYSNSYTWYYSTNENANANSSTGWKRLNNQQIYFVYTHNSGLYITDNMETDGSYSLSPELVNTDGTVDTTKTVASCVWSSSASETGDYETVTRKDSYQISATETASNLSDDGKKLYPAYDDGARKWYKVTVTYTDGTQQESYPFQVSYYSELENGSFEDPVYSEGMNQVSNASYWNASPSGVWQSTGAGQGTKVGKDIEILTNGSYLSTYYAWNYYTDNHAPANAAYDGRQFAELNCEAAGALYQDVLTPIGTSMNYWLSHRARGDSASSTQKGYDTMFLIIMPTKMAEDNHLDTQSNLQDYLDKILPKRQKVYSEDFDVEETEELYNGNGVRVLRVTSSNWNWHHINEITKPYVATSNLTRFFFMAGKTASTATNANTVGNFLDDVGFTKDLPPVADNEYSIEIDKNFKGLSDTQIDTVKSQIKFRISSVTDRNGNAVDEDNIRELFNLPENADLVITGDMMTKQANGTLKYIVANHDIGVNDNYTVTLTEENAGLSGYQVKTTTKLTTKVGDADPATTNAQANSVTFTIQGKGTVTAAFTNEYEASNNKKVNFTKIWDDNNNKWNTRPDSLTITLKATYDVLEGGKTVTKELTASNLGLTNLSYELTGDMKANKWTYTWEVPTYWILDKATGAKAPINYTVEEGAVGGDYVYTSPTNGKAVSGNGEDYTMSNWTGVTNTGENADSSQTETSTSKVNVFAKLKARIASVFANDDAATAADTDSNTNTLGVPAHRKYITYNKETSDYTLNLDVTGAEGSADGVDVLFVIDTSGSMGGSSGLLTRVKNLLNGTNGNQGIVDKILNANNKNAVAYVSFAGKAETNTTSWYTAGSSQTFKNKVSALRATGGTNWTYAMQQANSVLNDRTSNNKKVVIFLSDGQPTYSINVNGDQYGYGNRTIEAYYTESINAVKNSRPLNSVDNFYSVYLTSGTKTGMEKFNNGINGTVEGAQAVDGSGSKLESALNDIINQVIPTYENVTISDTLSKYVEFTGSGTPEITVTKVDANGAKTTLSEGTAAGTYRVINNGSDEKNISVAINGSLEKGATYTVSFNVKPSQAANAEYIEKNGYSGRTGDVGTGITSAGKEGFYSNENADLSYTVAGSDDGTKKAEYKKPVVQVLDHTLTFTKVWNQPKDVKELVDRIELTVYYTDNTTDDITLTANDNWTKTIEVPVTRNISNVVEKNIPANYTPSYSYPSATEAVVTNNYSKLTSTNVTVKKEWKGSGNTEPITVALMRSEVDAKGNAIGNATEYATVTLNGTPGTDPEDGSGKYGADGWSYTWKDLPKESADATSKVTYAYGILEKNIPAGYQSNISYDFSNGTNTVATITNTYDENCADEDYYIANVLQTEQLDIRKEWQDNGNAAELRPSDLKVKVGDMDFTLKDTDGWKKTVIVPKTKNVLSSASENLATDSPYHQVGTAEISRDDNAGICHVLFKNELGSTEITVTKDWNDNLDLSAHAEDYVTFQVLRKISGTPDTEKNWENFGTYVLNADSSDVAWTETISDLPEGYDYKVIELTCGVGNDTDENAYSNNYVMSGVTASENGKTFTITNTLKWSAIKVSQKWDDNDTSTPDGVGLEGATFELMKGTTRIATGTSGATGLIAWTPQPISKGSKETYDLYSLDGEYTIHEIQAPAGYVKHEDWTVTFDKGLLTTVDGKKITGSREKGVELTLGNKKVYSLPSTGGTGIFLYMIGGMLLMGAAAWILYKNKRREVLKR
ncbi:DUF7604 domain-containing protein [Eubacterium ramulus]